MLDVGTGPGAVAASMALLGHEVTGIDLCSNMIRRAKAAAERLGLPIILSVSVSHLSIG